MDFSLPTPANLFGMFFFSLVGFGAFRYGRRSGHTHAIVVGILLMIYPYFISATWLLYVVGAALCAALLVLGRWF